MASARKTEKKNLIQYQKQRFTRAVDRAKLKFPIWLLNRRIIVGTHFGHVEKNWQRQCRLSL